eukprot:6068343-Alexandrium_andersonii.AAC.1
MPGPRGLLRGLPGRRPGHAGVERSHHLRGVVVERVRGERAQVARDGHQDGPELTDALALGEDVLGDVV